MRTHRETDAGHTRAEDNGEEITERYRESREGRKHGEDAEENEGAGAGH